MFTRVYRYCKRTRNETYVCNTGTKVNLDVGLYRTCIIMNIHFMSIIFATKFLRIENFFFWRPLTAINHIIRIHQRSATPISLDHLKNFRLQLFVAYIYFYVI